MITRLISYNPAAVYNRITGTVNPLQRTQTRRDMNMQQLFPARNDGTCDCGCGRTLQGRQRRWATEDCGLFAWYVYAIIAGRRDEIKRCLRAYYGRKCSNARRCRGAVKWPMAVPVVGWSLTIFCQYIKAAGLAGYLITGCFVRIATG